MIFDGFQFVHEGTLAQQRTSVRTFVRHRYSRELKVHVVGAGRVAPRQKQRSLRCACQFYSALGSGGANQLWANDGEKFIEARESNGLPV